MFKKILNHKYFHLFILFSGVVLLPLLTGCDTEQINPWQTGAVEGIVTDLTGTPIPEAKVYLPDFIEQSSTDINGKFYLNEIPVGTNTIMAKRDGYTNDAKSIIIEGNKTSENQNFTLIHLPVWAQEKNITTQDYLNTYSNN